MQLYDFILQNDPSLADAEAICRDGAILCESEVTEQPKPTHSRPEGDPINGVQIWYDYAADYYFFEEHRSMRNRKPDRPNRQRFMAYGSAVSRLLQHGWRLQEFLAASTAR